MAGTNGTAVVEQVVHALALVAAVLSVPFALLSAVFLTGADDEGNSVLAGLLGLLLIPASIVSAVAVLALVRGDPWATTEVVVFAPAVLAAVAGPFGGPRSYHRAWQHTGDVVTSQGYFRPGDPGYPVRPEPPRRRRYLEAARTVAVLLIVPALVLLVGLVA